MSNESIFPDEEHEFRSRSSSLTPGRSTDGATTIPSASGTRCSTSGSSASPMTSGDPATSLVTSGPQGSRSLSEIVAEQDYDTRIHQIAERIGSATSHAGAMALFRLAVQALGVESAMFANFVRDASTLSSCRFMLACDPHWCQRYVDDGFLACDPWLAYAAHHSEPIVASHLSTLSPAQQEVVSWATECGFGSASLVPVHSGIGHPRVSLLCLGVAAPAFFDDNAFGRFRLGARLIAAELHDWWRSRLRQEGVRKARLTPAELDLLRHECAGHSSKHIAAELQVSNSSINSRFQRLNAKLGVPNRRSAVRLAVELGLVNGSGTS